MNKHKISVEILKSEKMLQTKTDYLCIYTYIYMYMERLVSIYMYVLCIVLLYIVYVVSTMCTRYTMCITVCFF